MKNIRQNKMEVMPVGKLLLSMGIPMIVSMVLQAVYNIVDSAFVSNMDTGGENALNALTLAFPLQILMVAVGIGTGVGANVLVAKSLGMKDSERAGKAAGNAVFLAFVIYIVFLVFGIIGAGAYIRSQTSNAEIAGMGTDYLRICCIFSFGMSFFAVYEKLLQSTGHSICSTIAQIMGAVTNIILDPILIYGWLGLPVMGVKGAAYATVIWQVVSFVAALIFHLKINTVIQNKLCYFKPALNTIKDIYAIGLPAIISQALISVMTYGLNLIFGGISEAMVTAYGLYYKIQQFLLFAAFGMRDAIMPVTAFSFGMGDKKRVQNCVKYGHIYTAIIMIAGLVAIEILAVPFSNIFGLSGETQALFISAMKIISVSFVFAGVNTAFQGMFQAMEGGMESLVISICRQVVFIFPFALIFAVISKSDYAMTWLSWITFPVAETLTAVIAVLLFRRIGIKQKKFLFKHLTKKKKYVRITLLRNNVIGLKGVLRMKSDKETKEKLLESAKSEFLEKGYMKASLRKICADAGVTTGALYFFFEGKEDLFAAIVEPPLNALTEVLSQHFIDDMSIISAPGFIEQYSFAGDQDHEIFGVSLVHHIYQNYDAFMLLLTKAQGSRFENCVDYLVELIEKSYREMANGIVAQNPGSKVNEYMSHWFTHISVDAFIHLLTHEPDEQKAVGHMKLIMDYLVRGWMNMILMPED